MKLVYIATVTMKSIWRNKFVACIQTLCFALGMLIPFFFVSQYYAAHADAEKNIKLIDTKNLLQLEPDMKADANSVMQKPEISAFSKMFPSEEIHFINYIYTDNVLIHNKVCAGASICIVDNSIDRMWRDGWLAEGSGLKKGKKDCIVGKSFAKKYKISVGDFIEVEQERYLVSGIFDIPAYKRNILLNVDGVSKLDLWDVKYFVKMKRLDENKVTEIEKYIFGMSGMCTINKEEEITKKYFENLKDGWLFSIIISVISLLYGMINLYNILYFFFIKTRKNVFICITQGATKLHLFLQKYIEIAINTFFSSVLSYLLLQVIQNSKIQYMFEIKADGVIFLLMFLVGQICACLYAYLIICKMNKIYSS